MEADILEFNKLVSQVKEKFVEVSNKNSSLVEQLKKAKEKPKTKIPNKISNKVRLIDIVQAWESALNGNMADNEKISAFNAFMRDKRLTSMDME